MSKAITILVVWCQDCESYDGYYEGPGHLCPGDHETVRGYRKLVKRKLYACSEGPKDRRGIYNVGFLAATEARDHENHYCKDGA